MEVDMADIVFEFNHKLAAFAAAKIKVGGAECLGVGMRGCGCGKR